MAKILLITESFHSQSAEGLLTLGLTEELSSHEVLVATRYDQEIFSSLPSNVEVITPFRKFSHRELIQLLPKLMNFRAQVATLIQPYHYLTKQSLGLWSFLLPVLSPLNLQTHLQYFHFDPQKAFSLKHRLLLDWVDKVTVPDELSRQLLEYNAKKAEVGNMNFPSQEGLKDRSFWWKSTERKNVLVPGQVSMLVNPFALFRSLASFLKKEPRAFFIFSSGWGKLSAKQKRKFDLQLKQLGLGERVLFLSQDCGPEGLKQCSFLLVGHLSAFSFEAKYMKGWANQLGVPQLHIKSHELIESSTDRAKNEFNRFYQKQV